MVSGTHTLWGGRDLDARLTHIVPVPLDAGVRIEGSGETFAPTVGDFWQWQGSDLLNNAMRGVLAEYIVHRAAGGTQKVRVEWDAYDIETEGGLKIEVKSAAYLQSWVQREESKITFNIRKTTRLDEATNSYEGEAGRWADVYVFCVLAHRDKRTVNPLDLRQWQFHVVPTKTIDVLFGDQQSVSLSVLERRAEAAPLSYQELKAALRGRAYKAR